ncbi:MAG: two-component sensor histidine kinase [Deltaproteobacteria bacterium]|nr:two-component sensor histidine kinase [Deltaproteobacteria bacterium]
MTARSRPPDRRAHLGLLVTTVLTAMALLASAGVNQLSAAATADTVTRSRALDMARAARGALRQGRGDPGEALQTLVDEWGKEGLRYAAVFGPDGAILSEAGTPAEPVEALARRLTWLPRGPDAEPERVGDIIRVGVPIRPAGARGRAARGARPAILVVEMEPVMADAILGRARLGLVVSGAAALALLVLAAVFWRMSRRAERAEAELARDRHLAALGEMSAVLGHEIRNPLASLKGHAQLLVEKLADAPAAQAKAERVVNEALRLERLTTEVLQFARSGEVERQPASPAAVLVRAVDVAGEGRVDVDVDTAPERFSLDAVRLEQVLVNLVRNAVQASPPGARVEARAAAAPGGGLLLEVRDKGPGLPDDDVERLFEPFQTDKVRGTGLGLAVARRIVDAHGGTIRASNHPEGGAVLTVRLPAA